MVSKKSGSQILDVQGKMYFELKKDCDAWATDQKFQLYYEYADSTPVAVTSSLSAYEPFDGKSMAFNSRRSRNGELYEELSGTAGIGVRKAVYSVPKDLSFRLPENTLFPMVHTTRLLQEARAGARTYNAVVFDGSDDTGPVEINAVIGLTPAPPPADSRSMSPALSRARAWKIRLAFFPLNTAESESEYEMDAVLQENGVIRDMRVEYKDFSVTQTLTALQPLPPENCGIIKKAPGGRN